jgi:hypothetical protein
MNIAGAQGIRLGVGSIVTLKSIDSALTFHVVLSALPMSCKS